MRGFVMEALWEFLALIKRELVVIGTAAIPVVELRGAIPVGMAMGLSMWHSFMLALIGSLIPVPLLLYFLRPVVNYLKETKLLRWFAVWLENRTMKKSKRIKNLSLIGLCLFVAIPFPTTGVWTGCAIAAFLGMRISHAFCAIAIGDLIAGLIVMTFSNFFF